MSMLSAAIGLFAKARMAKIRRLYRDPARVQRNTLKSLLRAARDTEWGQKYDYASIQDIRTYQARVPLSTYLDFRPIWDRYFSGQTDLTWPGRPGYF
ncbi:MAG: GH3 family domain-containing protein, partial [Candidatus Methylomirabilales bacterium]